MSGIDVRYLIVFLCLLSIAGCGQSQYERCLKVEKAKIIKNWEDIYEIAQRLVLDFSFPLDFDGVLDREITTQQDIQNLRDSLEVLADLPLAEISKMIEQGIEDPGLEEVLEADLLKVELAWGRYFELVDESLAGEDSAFFYERIDDVIISYEKTMTSDSQNYVNYFGLPDEMLLAAQYEIINEIEKSTEEDMKKIDLVQNEISANICNSRGLY